MSIPLAIHYDNPMLTVWCTAYYGYDAVFWHSYCRSAHSRKICIYGWCPTVCVCVCVCVCVFIVSTIEYAILGFAAAVPVICVRRAGVYDVRRPTIKREIERAMNSLSAVAPRRQTDCTD